MERALGFVVDRHADVPVGVQIAWALRAKIGEGALAPGARLPGLRELANAAGVNVNTARAVYQRLEQAGLVDSQQGSGTFVAAAAQASALGLVTVLAAEEAREQGVSPRDLATALYMRPETPRGRRSGESERRRLLRNQIAALEMAAAELEAENHVAVKAAASEPARRRTLDGGPRLLGVEELEAVRASLVRRLAAVQAAIDETDEVTGQSGARRAAKPRGSVAPSPARGSRRRPPRAGLAET